MLLEPASPTVVVDDLIGVRWSKLAINCVTTTLGATGGVALGRLLSHRPIRRLALEVFAEVAAVAKAEGVKLQPVGGTLDIDKIAITEAERQLSFGSPSLAYKHSILLAVGLKYRRMRSSMLYALERGRPPEIDFLNGEIVRRGQGLGVPTPVNEALVAQVRAIVEKRAKPSLDALKAIHDAVVEKRARLAA
jgi:2-dehydropantoate 2-reductase